MPDLFMVFDVESVGLHGEAFAVGWILIRRDGKELEGTRAACDPSRVDGDEDGRLWVRANVPDLGHGFLTPRQLRDVFWQGWREAEALGAVLAADVPWPVEARFLARCIDDDPAARQWQGPYPLIDIASVRLAAGLDPLGVGERLPDELPAHDPLCDARQSARLLLEALRKCAPGGDSCE